MVIHNLVSFATVVPLRTLVTLLIMLIRVLLKWKYIHCKYYAILAAMMRKRSYFVTKVSSRSPGLKCSYEKIFIPVTEISVAKTEISVTGPARPLIWTQQNFYEGKRGEARSRKPSQPGWPGSYEEALNVPVKTTQWQFSMERPRWYPPEEDKHGGRSLFWLCRNFSSLLNCTYSHFSLHTVCSDLKNTRWIDVSMCVIYVSQQSPLCHGLWKKKNMKFKLFYFPNKVGYRAGNMQADISQNVFYPMKIKLQNSAGAPVCK